MERKPIYWSTDDDCETLSETDKDQAILDGLNYINEDPEKITIYGWARKPVDVSSGWLQNTLLERLLEELDVEYGDDATTPTDSMKAAALKFVDDVVAEYVPYWCDVVCEEEIDVKEWRKERERE